MIKINKTKTSNLDQGSQFHTVSASTAGIYRTGQQSNTFDPPISYQKKYQLYRSHTGRIDQFRAILGVPTGTEFLIFFLSFVIFEFLLRQNDNLFALTY